MTSRQKKSATSYATPSEGLELLAMAVLTVEDAQALVGRHLVESRPLGNALAAARHRAQSCGEARNSMSGDTGTHESEFVKA